MGPDPKVDEVSDLRRQLETLRNSIAAIHCTATRRETEVRLLIQARGSSEVPKAQLDHAATMAAIADECEHAVPELKPLRPNWEGKPAASRDEHLDSQRSPQEVSGRNPGLV